MQRTRRMNVFLVLLGGLLVALLLFFGSIYYFYANSLGHEYTYEARVTVNGTIANATFYLPLPAVNGASPVADAMAVDRVTVTPGWNAAIVATRYGPMLGLSTSSFTPQERVMQRTGNATHQWVQPVNRSTANLSDPDIRAVRQEYGGITTRIPVREHIDTRTPDTGEPVFLHLRENRTACAPLMVPVDANCATFTTAILANVTAAEHTSISIAVDSGGANLWWAYGWTGNWYRERVQASFRGSNQGWLTVSGIGVANAGSYTWY